MVSNRVLSRGIQREGIPSRSIDCQADSKLVVTPQDPRFAKDPPTRNQQAAQPLVLVFFFFFPKKKRKDENWAVVFGGQAGLDFSSHLQGYLRLLFPSRMGCWPHALLAMQTDSTTVRTRIMCLADSGMMSFRDPLWPVSWRESRPSELNTCLPLCAREPSHGRIVTDGTAGRS